MYTVEAAAARGIPVGAVPGSIRSPTSEGTNGLLADGCFPVCAVADILTALSLRGRGAAGRRLRPAPPGSGAPDPDGTSSADRSPVRGALLRPGLPRSRWPAVTGMEIPALCGGLERLARAGVARDVGGWWERT